MSTTPLPLHIEVQLSRFGVVPKRVSAHAPVAWPKKRPTWPVTVTVLDENGQPEF